MNSQKTGAALKIQKISSPNEANSRFYEALSQMSMENMDLMTSVWSQSDEAMLLGPFGGRQVGWDDIRQEYERESQMNLRRRIEPVDVKLIDCGDLAIVNSWERGSAITSDGMSITIAQRATNIFRKEQHGWKLFFRQTDPASRLQELEWDDQSYGQQGCDD